MQFSVRYIVLFSAAVCVVCAILVSSSAVTLKDLQTINKALDKKQNALEAAGLVEPGEKLTQEEVDALFENVRIRLVDVQTGEVVAEGPEAENFDQQRAKKDPDASFPAPANRAGIKRVPERAQIFEVLGDGGEVEMVILPIEGYGLWSTLLGFVALDADLQTIRGLTYYDHGETPGLGGEVDNPAWKKLWPGRKVYGLEGSVDVEVIKGSAGPASEDPYRVDGLSGATITSRGITNMLRFWLGDEGFGPYLDSLREQSGGERRAA